MYIPYEEISKLPFLKKYKDFFYNKKIEQNCNYIEKNKKKVLKKLKNKKHFKVAFYVYDLTKWKCQKLYEEIKETDCFDPFIVVTKNAAKNLDNPSYQSEEEIKNTFNYFKSKGEKVELGYDFEKQKHIPFKKFNPDIIIYQHPWYVETTQGPVICSKFALTYYVPYDIPTTELESDYGLRFHSYIENYIVFNKKIEETFKSKMKNNGKNLFALGSPSSDYIHSNGDNDYVIYAPHWTINHKKTIAYSTFEQTGKFMLEYAKEHSEFNWVFKPHPMLKKAIIDNELMTKEEVENYYKDWEKLGTCCYDCNYYEIFNNSKLMITDCSTFLIEYFMTQKPLIHLVPEIDPNFNDFTKDIIKNYYKTRTLEELKQNLDNILINNNDTMKHQRHDAFNNLDLIKNSSKQIIQHILKTVEY